MSYMIQGLNKRQETPRPTDEIVVLECPDEDKDELLCKLVYFKNKLVAVLFECANVVFINDFNLKMYGLDKKGNGKKIILLLVRYYENKFNFYGQMLIIGNKDKSKYPESIGFWNKMGFDDMPVEKVEEYVDSDIIDYADSVHDLFGREFEIFSEVE